LCVPYPIVSPMEAISKIDSIKNLLAYSSSVSPETPNFDPLLVLLSKIQKQGKFPTFSQIEDQLPVNVYSGSKSKYSFKEYILRAERAKLVHVNRTVQPSIIIALEKPKPQQSMMTDMNSLKSYIPSISSAKRFMPTLSMSKLPLQEMKGALKKLYYPPAGYSYKKLDQSNHLEKDDSSMNMFEVGGCTRRSKHKLDQFDDFL
jgi:hypothetical protein